MSISLAYLYLRVSSLSPSSNSISLFLLSLSRSLAYLCLPVSFVSPLYQL